ncbi:MAG: tetratricopeptide repeat protein [Ignavibacterium sp.]|nr:tetratricopeptide repeat protein [Ignavibacterium sp.]MCX7612173.1 tetratricopeptide repeat protein [Ignavibacterium sp.]MDW8376242.1 tetratricopeptide repeat protein [Ignavibacteriales bacterium]
MVDKDKILLAVEYFEKGYRLHISGDVEKAIDAYRKSINYYPTPKAHNFLGWALSLLGKYEEAIEECKIAIELDPDYGNPYNDIGTYLVNLNRYDESIYWFQKALQARDYDSPHIALYNLGRVFEKKGMWFNALKYYKEAIELNPDYPPAVTSYHKLLALLN